MRCRSGQCTVPFWVPERRRGEHRRRFADGTLQSFDVYWDGADNLRAIWVHGGSQIWAAAYNGDNLLVSLQDTASGTFPTQHEFSWGLGGLLYDLYQSATYTPGISQRVNGVDSFFHTDWLGSTRDLSDGTGNNFPSVLRYDAFGNKSAWMGNYDPTVFQFAGDWGYQTQWGTGPEDGLGLQYLQQRYYDPAVGRFLSPDPVGFAGGPNLYGYANNDPVNGVDPSGLTPHQQVVSGVRRFGTGLANGINFVLGLPGRAWNGIRHRFFGVTLQPGTPTLGKANPAAYPGLPGAGQEINQFVENENADIANQVFYGAVGAVGTATGSGWLYDYHEGPQLGHTFAHLHVGATDAELVARLSAGGISKASTFLDEAVAEASISKAIRASRPNIRLWLQNGGKGPFVINFAGTDIIGRGIAKGESAVGWRTNVTVVLRANGRGGYFVRTAYPF